MKNIYNLIVVGNQKAITSFVLAGAAVWLTAVGVSLEMTVGEALTILVAGVINAAGVWLKANK